MGETKLGEALEELDKRFNEGLSVDDLKRKGVEIETIIRMIDDSLVYLDNTNRKIYNEKKGYNPDVFRVNIGGVWMKLGSNGYALLNQIRTKKALETLDVAIAEFNSSSESSSEKLNTSITKFDESSKKASNMLIVFTILIGVATVVEVVLTAISLSKTV